MNPFTWTERIRYNFAAETKSEKQKRNGNETREKHGS